MQFKFPGILLLNFYTNFLTKYQEIKNKKTPSGSQNMEDLPKEDFINMFKNT